MSNPPTVTVPLEGGIKPVIMRMVVDLPAPLGPRNPSTSPRSTEKEIPSTARLVPNSFGQILNFNHFDCQSVSASDAEKLSKT